MITEYKRLMYEHLAEGIQAIEEGHWAFPTEIKMQWKAAADRVLIKAEERKETTDSGIVIPANAKVGGTAKGVVLASGPSATNVLPGDIAIYDTKYARVVADGVVSIQADLVLALQREE